MDRSDTEQKSAGGALVSSAANTRLTGSRLIIARAVWLTLVVPSLGLFVVGLPVYYQRLQTACVNPATCYIAGALPAKELQTLSTIGFSASAYAALLTIFYAITVSIWSGVGLLIFWRRSDDWLALLAAFVLVIGSITQSGSPTYALGLVNPVLTWSFSLLDFLWSVSLAVFFLLFPNGRLIPCWMGLFLPYAITYAFFNNFPSPASSFDTNWPAWLYLLVTLIFYGALIFSQIYRYRRVSTPLQRQQTKWIVSGVTAVVGVLIGLLVIAVLIPSIDNSFLFNEVWIIIFPVVLLLIPLSIGFSILRYRLYDIDLLINRTLVYGSLTAILALVYVGLIFVLQYLLRGIINQQNDVAIVVSTLAIAALFQPLRHRIQAIIDHRFYRRKYDAAKTVEAFSATLRNEVDLSQLRDHLLNVVQETMQPAHVSLWLRSPGRHTEEPRRKE